MAAWYLIGVFGAARRCLSLAFGLILLVLCVHIYDFWTIRAILKFGLLPDLEYIASSLFWFGIRNIASTVFWGFVVFHAWRFTTRCKS